MSTGRNDTPDVLKKIIRTKCEEVIFNKKKRTIKELKESIEHQRATNGFVKALKKSVAKSQPAVIAEVKKASPSKGIIREDFKPVDIARSYQLAGATCLSVLTDRSYFHGSDQYLIDIKKISALPVLRKDFIVDPYQVYETRAIGADCILLIASVFVLDPLKLEELIQLSYSLSLDVLVEIHNEQELNMVMSLDVDCNLIGVNNRNLHTFETNLDVTLNLIGTIPRDKLLVAESGIHTRDDVNLLKDSGVLSFLVGEAFMRQHDPGEGLKQLFF
jgi:indole-3-glycerol phosphate synthase